MNVESSGNEPQNAASDTLESPTAPPVKRMRIGSERDQTAETAPKPNTVTPPSSPPPAQPARKKLAQKHYPPPNIRDQLSPELQAEYEAALSDLSFDALMSQAATGEVANEIMPESRVTGRVVRVHRDDVFIDLGGRNQGVVPLRQFETPPKEGDELELLVVRFNADEGFYELSRTTAAVDVGNWDEVTEGQIIEVTVTGANKGGLECQVAGIRAFIPMGQVSIYRVENPEELVGQRLACVVTEASRERRNLVLSHRAVMERQRNEQREKLVTELAPGQIREGI